MWAKIRRFWLRSRPFSDISVRFYGFWDRFITPSKTQGMPFSPAYSPAEQALTGTQAILSEPLIEGPSTRSSQPGPSHLAAPTENTVYLKLILLWSSRVTRQATQVAPATTSPSLGDDVIELPRSVFIDVLSRLAVNSTGLADSVHNHHAGIEVGEDERDSGLRNAEPLDIRACSVGSVG
jgi:hypothetical protein